MVKSEQSKVNFYRTKNYLYIWTIESLVIFKQKLCIFECYSNNWSDITFISLGILSRWKLVKVSYRHIDNLEITKLLILIKVFIKRVLTYLFF